MKTIEQLRTELINEACTLRAREQINTLLDKLQNIDLGPQKVSFKDLINSVCGSPIAWHLREWFQEARKKISKDKSKQLLNSWLDFVDGITDLESLVNGIDSFVMSDIVPAELYPEIAQKNFLRRDIPHVDYLKEMGRKKLKGDLWEAFNFVFCNALSFSLYHKWGNVDFAASDSQMGWDLCGDMGNNKKVLFQSKFVAPGQQLYGGQANELETFFGEAACDPNVSKLVLFTSARMANHPNAIDPIHRRYRRWTDDYEGAKSRLEILDFNRIDVELRRDVNVADIFWRHTREEFGDILYNLPEDE